MKRTLLALAALAALATVAAAPLTAQAQSWQSINQRQANLDRRIDQGVRNGALTRSEAQRLRGEFRSISRLEVSYRRSNGLSMRERADLDARFDRLSRQIQIERHDRDDGRDRHDRHDGRRS
jgi:Spy/CpxP family protein refolding chaperone